jgi:glutamate dehydrogenase
MHFPYSSDYVAAIFSRYPKITKMLVSFFKEKFREDQHDLSVHLKQIYEELKAVSRIDDDRIIRRFLNILQATLRTNYYQDSFGSYLSFKFDSMLIDGIPEPKPLFEIFIYSPRFEACHLRGGKVSRGGIRWSDRAEDFRDEVLGLMKAQMVKNSIIVPLGSKGGFFVKNYETLLTQGSSAEALRLEVVSCYRLMMEGLLGLTDNLINGKIVKPIDTVCYDNDDPYLVVAADKGTATFSDTANSVSRDYGFWLGDAFASGGSYGYDHKKIAITARGAFVSIDRHFRELDFDIYKTPFTAVGVGDMAGDVFGNGMLQTDKIKLIGAFNHQHIFLDPNPDAEASYCERKRLFDLPNSKWSDYNLNCLSKGGGIFNRSLKIIPLSFEVRSFLSAAFQKEISEELSPDELISYLIRAPVDLLWFGGIGTFIKESYETHTEVGDHQNDRVRVNAKDINARVIGEGANLAMTQRARVEYALKGGKINTDAIDNSAGVDCSDHEVNLKVLFSTLLTEGRITFDERNQLLKSMTEDVTDLILEDNKRQTQILSIMERLASKEIDTYRALIRNLESDPYYPLNRALEFLPEDDEFERRLSQKQSLTRPELAILLAYSKISLYQRILDSGLPENSYFDDYLIRYFPELIQSDLASEIKKHPLRNEIVATVLSNQLINRVGPEFIFEISQVVGVSIIEVLDAFVCIVRIFNLEALWDEVENIQSLEDRYKTLISIKQGIEQCVVVLLRHKVSCSLDGCLIHLGQSIDVLLTEFKQQSEDAEFENYKNIWPILLDIACEGPQENPQELISACLASRSVFGFENMSVLINSINVDSQWQKSAKVSLFDDLINYQAQLVKQIVAAGGINEWLQTRQNMVGVLQQNSRLATNDFAFLSYSVRQLQRLF